jgi:tRNA threonylcarbamoyladenosine biosynthesis protein TsaB
MIKFSPILSIETSGNKCSAALYYSESEYFEKTVTGKHIHSQKLLTIIDELLSEKNISIKTIKSIAISVGPGSFTGLRIGMSVAKGLAFGIEIPIIPVPTYEALALQISSEIKNIEKFVVANSVNVDELYAAEYKAQNERYELLEDVHLINKKDFSPEKYQDFQVLGNYSEHSEYRGYSAPNALFVAKWAYIFGKDLVTSEYDYLEPNYIKNFIVKEKK